MSKKRENESSSDHKKVQRLVDMFIFQSQVLRLIRIAKAAKTVKMATKFSGVLKLSKANKLIKIGHETYDLIRTVNGRLL
jgi:hypothetical protein